MIHYSLQNNKFISNMLKDSAFTVYRKPFKLKASSDAKMSALKSSSPATKVLFASSNNIHISPYVISQVDLLRHSKPLKTADTQRQRKMQGYYSTVKVRANSATYHSSQPNKPVEIIFQEKQASKPVTSKAKTSHLVFTRSASTKNIRSRSSLGIQNHLLHHHERKFIITFANIDKKKEKSKNQLNEKMEHFDYKAVLGDKLPSKKIPKLFIDEHGVVSRQHI